MGWPKGKKRKAVDEYPDVEPMGTMDINAKPLKINKKDIEFNGLSQEEKTMLNEAKEKVEGKEKYIPLPPIHFSFPEKKPTEKQLKDYFTNSFGRTRVHLRGDTLKDIDEFKLVIKIKKRF